MSVISDLVDRLRVESKSMGTYGVDYMATLLMQASDTIAMLSEKARIADRPQGEWIEQEDDYHHYWECSECGMGVGLDDIRNFCPNCGADMREREGE